jgi:multimeric flavodoxin WrbA
MIKNILIISGSPKKNGNTDTLISWFCEGIKSSATEITVIRAAGLKLKTNGCTSCRSCQKQKEYGCVINDDIKTVQKHMIEADMIVMATPLYFFSASAQLKVIVDRMFSLYKWDNNAGTMKTILKGKTFVLIASAYEDVGLKELESPFRLTAEYSGMKFKSLLIPNAGVSGQINNITKIKQKTVQFAKSIYKNSSL